MTTDRRSDSARSELLEAAINRLAVGPGTAVDFDGIASEVGLTKGALYHHFGSVGGLLEEVYREAVQRHASRVIERTRGGSGRERLLDLIQTSAELYGSETSFYKLLLRLHVEAGVSRPELAPIARKVQRRQREYMTSLVEIGQADGSIRSDIDPQALGETVNAALQGFLVQQLEPRRAQQRAVEAFAGMLEVML